MKRSLKSLLVLAGFGLVSPAIADVITVGGVDVGDIDTILAVTEDTGVASTTDTTSTGCASNSGDAAETCWAEYHTGEDLTLGSKAATTAQYVTVDDGVNPPTVSETIIAFALSEGPGYYIIKNSTAWILMDNLSSIDWGVLDLSLLDDTFNLENLTISHVSQFDGEMEVPEPATLGLLGLGLIGVGFVRRRRTA